MAIDPMKDKVAMVLSTEFSIQDFVEEQRGILRTPYYLIDEARLVKNLAKIAQVREQSGAKSVLALKCFSTWSVFELMRQYMDGTTSSSLFEARLGHDKFGKEVHAYSVAFSEEEIKAIRPIATKIIFNSISQLMRFEAFVKGKPLVLRVNPGISHSEFDLANPARKCSRLGATDFAEIMSVSGKISGVMFHCNCENDDFENFSAMLDQISARFEPLLRKLE